MATLYGTVGSDSINGTAAGDLILGSDSIGNDNGNDTINGLGGNDTIRAGVGNDVVDGGTGNDSILGDAGNDLLMGGDGDDTIHGNNAANSDLSQPFDDDTLIGGAGNDLLFGGRGSDLFVWDRLGNDTIADFGRDSQTLGGVDTWDSGINTDNDRVDLSAIFNMKTLKTYNLLNGTSFTSPLDALDHDLRQSYSPTGTGSVTLNFNGTDMSGPTLTFRLDYLTQFLSGKKLTYEQVNVWCFARGTLIRTPHGDVPVEVLSAGDLVMTRDNGAKPISWIGSRHLSAAALKANPKLRPIIIRKGALGENTPSQDLTISPQHRVLAKSRIAQNMFCASEVLVAAKQLLAIDGIDTSEQETVEYWHLLFEDHEIVYSNGAETESLYPGPEALKALGPEAIDEIQAIFPELCNFGKENPFPSVRPLLSGRDGRKLAERHVNKQRPLI
ncbi:MAG: Hint domain-containing protein [Gemmobacter sp.]|jgi:hypothetical protein|nr:Hint domain-containing protein [Gemmobacter sp.]